MKNEIEENSIAEVIPSNEEGKIDQEHLLQQKQIKHSPDYSTSQHAETKPIGSPPQEKMKQPNATSWLQPVLIGIGTAALSAILVTLITYIGTATNIKMGHNYDLAKVQDDRQYSKVEAEKLKNIQKITSDIDTMRECAKEFEVLHGMMQMAEKTLA